jgi:hypothetical protein
MTDELSIYQGCAANFSAVEDLDGLLECISDVSGVRVTAFDIVNQVRRLPTTTAWSRFAGQ